MSDDLRYDAVHVDLNPAAALDEPRAAQMELLDGGEIIELSIKPSLWFIAVVSFRCVLVVAVAAVFVAWLMRNAGLASVIYVAPLACLCAVARIMIAAMQWASRVYILTNRRVMRLAGVLNVSVEDVRLANVGVTNLELSPGPRLFGLGTIRITSSGDAPRSIAWEHVARAGDIYAKLIRAVKKAQSKQ